MLFSLSYQTPLSKFGLKGENNMPVTIVDIAKEAGCSAATVSLVMKNSPKIKSSTKQRVMEIANRLGYTPNFAARSLINGQTNLIGRHSAESGQPSVCHYGFRRRKKGIRARLQYYTGNLLTKSGKGKTVYADAFRAPGRRSASFSFFSG